MAPPPLSLVPGREDILEANRVEKTFREDDGEVFPEEADERNGVTDVSRFDYFRRRRGSSTLSPPPPVRLPSAGRTMAKAAADVVPP